MGNKVGMNSVRSLLFRRSAVYRGWSSKRDFERIAREGDLERNRATTPPDDEYLGFRALWVAESFPLAALPGLAASIERLQRADDYSPGNRETAQMVRDL